MAWNILVILSGLAAGFYVCARISRVIRCSLLPRYRSPYRIQRRELTPGELKEGNPGYYYWDAEACIHDFILDKGGVINECNDGEAPREHPTQIALFALVAYDRYLKGDRHSKETFLRQLKWLADNAVRTHSGGINWTFSFKMGHEKGSWGSSITLGFAISALVRGFVETKEALYLDAAKQACQTLLSPVASGGYCLNEKPYTMWLEESNTHNHILNGHIFALMGVYDLFRVTQDPGYKVAFDGGVRCLKDNLEDFDCGYFSFYNSKTPSFSNNGYHWIHIEQLDLLARITGIEEFREKRSRFAAYQRSLKFRIRLLLALMVNRMKMETAQK